MQTKPSKCEILKTLVLSTRHLADTEQALLETRPGEIPLAYGPATTCFESPADPDQVEYEAHGWIVHMPGQDHGLPAVLHSLQSKGLNGLMAAVAICAAHGGHMLIFDADGPRIAGLPWYADEKESENA